MKGLESNYMAVKFHCDRAIHWETRPNSLELVVAFENSKFQKNRSNSKIHAEDPTLKIDDFMFISFIQFILVPKQ